MAFTKMQISPVFVNGFENGFHRWIQRIFLVVVEAKKIVFRKIHSNLSTVYECVTKCDVFQDFMYFEEEKKDNK